MSEKINPEIMSLRTKTSKTYDLGNGKRRLVLSSLDPILTIQGVGKDTYIKNIGPTSNYGDTIYIVVGWDYDLDEICRALFEFPINWGVDIPHGAVINAAIFSLYTYGITSSDDYIVSRLLRLDWEEMEATWVKYKSDSNWTTEGCGDDGEDYTSTDAVSIPVSTPTGWKSWTVTNQVKTAQTKDINVALRLAGATTSGEPSKYFSAYSKDLGEPGTGRPKLVIDYTVVPIEERLSSTLKAAQQEGFLNPIYKIVLTKGASSYTYEGDRILPSEHDEEMYSHRAKIVLNNIDHNLDDKDLKGYDAVISYGFGKEYLATSPLSVIDQQFDSTKDKLTCTLDLEGMPNLMAEDEASETYMPDEDAPETVKTLVNAIVGATLAPFTHCKAYEVVWDAGYDTLADTYKPKDGFRIYGGSRLASLRRALDYTANVPRFEDDGKVHILKPVTSGETFDYEYNLEKGHTFFSKAYRNSLVFPNRVVVKSQPDDDPQYQGEAQIDGYDSLPDTVKKTKFVRIPLESNDQAEDIAKALIAKVEMGSARGQAEIRINVGAEAFNYVKVTDQRQGDTRTGNLGYIHRRFGGDKWMMTFGFGNWLEYLRYQKILRELETYTDAGQYFSRLSVGDLYAENLLAKNMGFYWIDPDNTIDLSKIGDTLDNLPDGEQYARVSTWNLKVDEDPESPTYGLFVLNMDEHSIYQPGYDPTTKWEGEDLDDLPDGVAFQRVKSMALSADGLVLMDNIMAGTYGKIKSMALSANGMVLIDNTIEGTYGKIKSAALNASGLVVMDQVVDGTYGKLSVLDMDSHHIKLSSYTKASGEWYDEAGVEIDANTGINIYGPDVAFRTRATKTGAIQCHVGSDGCIYAGAGKVRLSATGLRIQDESLDFYDGSVYRGRIYGLSDGLRIAAATGKGIQLEGKVVSISAESLALPAKTSEPSSPYNGMLVFNISTGYTNVYFGGAWHHFNRDSGWA